MKKIIDNKQCTILWHVDELKTSHFDSAVVSSVLADIDAEYAISKIWWAAGVADSPFISSGILSSIFPMHFIIENITLPGEE